MIDKNILIEFEEGLNPLNVEKSRIPARIIGYGEISAVLEVKRKEFENFVIKRLPIFESSWQMELYESAYREYVEVLKKAGINIIDEDCASIKTGDGRFVFYTIQKKIPPEHFCNKIIRKGNAELTKPLLFRVMKEVKKVFDFNTSSFDLKIGLDGQVSNWAVKDISMIKNAQSIEKAELLYIDTSTPLMRKNGVEVLPADLFLKSTPAGLRSIVKALFLKEVIDRYYQLRGVILDLIANLFKDVKYEEVPFFVEVANEFLKKEIKGITLNPLSFKEVKKYYRKDAFIWSLFLTLRKMERFTKTYILNKRYDHLLPPRVQRYF